MRRKKTFTVDFADDKIQNRMSQRHTVISGSASPQLINDRQWSAGGIVDNWFCLLHFDEEGTFSGFEFVGGADTGEDSIYDGGFVRATGDEGAHLCHDGEERGGSEDGGFATHVGASEENDRVFEADVVGDKVDWI